LLEIRFLSGNSFKIEEASLILKEAGVSVVPVNVKVEELQTEDTFRLVKDKALKAFAKIGRPLFVEHTGLYIDSMNGLPGGLTQIFWDTLQADKFTQLFGKEGGNTLVAKTVIGFVDGKNFHTFEGSVKGHVPAEPIGNREFQWDCVFLPEGETETFAEMGNKKNEISMRRKALDKFSSFLGSKGHV
jgi:XTP/dITP diphosphohydrolase